MLNNFGQLIVSLYYRLNKLINYYRYRDIYLYSEDNYPCKLNTLDNDNCEILICHCQDHCNK